MGLLWENNPNGSNMALFLVLLKVVTVPLAEVSVILDSKRFHAIPQRLIILLTISLLYYIRICSSEKEILRGITFKHSPESR